MAPTLQSRILGDKVERAIDAVLNTEDRDREFAYWLCLTRNIDRYE